VRHNQPVQTHTAVSAYYNRLPVPQIERTYAGMLDTDKPATIRHIHPIQHPAIAESLRANFPKLRTLSDVHGPQAQAVFEQQGGNDEQAHWQTNTLKPEALLE
jgi:hypothetical protein